MAASGHNPPELFDGRPAGMSQVVSARGRVVMVSGQVAMTGDGAVVGVGDFEAQAVQVFENLRIALAAAGATLADVVKLNSYLTDMDNLAVLRDVRLRYLREPYPAATAVRAEPMSPELLLEVEAMAIVDD